VIHFGSEADNGVTDRVSVWYQVNILEYNCICCTVFIRVTGPSIIQSSTIIRFSPASLQLGHFLVASAGSGSLVAKLARLQGGFRKTRTRTATMLNTRINDTNSVESDNAIENALHI
jgi:hypothetical protein